GRWAAPTGPVTRRASTDPPDVRVPPTRGPGEPIGRPAGVGRAALDGPVLPELRRSVNVPDGALRHLRTLISTSFPSPRGRVGFCASFVQASSIVVPYNITCSQARRGRYATDLRDANTRRCEADAAGG